MSKKLKAYLTIIYLACFSVLVILSINYSYKIDFFDITFLLIVTFVMNNYSIFFNYITEIKTSMTLPVLLSAFYFVNPLWAGIIAAVGTITFKEEIKYFVWYKFLFNRAVFFLASSAGALIFNLTTPVLDSNSFPIMSTLFASIIYFIVNNFLVYVVINLADNDVNQMSLLSYFRELSKNLITSYFLGLVLLASYMYFSKVLFVLVIILLFIIKDFFYSRLQQMNSYTQIIESFLKVIDSKDHYTEGHCERVANYTYHLCNEMNLSRAKSEKIISIAKIHDIGKIYVDDDILRSSDKLSEQEYKEIKRHTEYGYQLLKDIDLINDELDIILYHHERWDGRGYPEGLKGEKIPVGARILTACDSLDVMITGRTYKPPMTKEEIIAEFKKCSGGQFDPEIARKMIQLIKDGYFDDKFKSEEKIRELELSLEY
ncbi:HD-GYP domain-containing protein [Halanaerobium sp. ST460_2HS_T2]|uniref:HD-GYP domain-containing protein n=1 Tax=Halanaerobium sp. ST460_2HS_T2 TaxID=2183914 RepID=UPI000DF2B623|nr:HD-GYP domain-containing protein [Halanaerobium sp. ST460_2HS_T2]RCW56222.1 HD domain-containing protein [Halanaerobium sp. ST460_2HS_T2]